MVSTRAAKNTAQKTPAIAAIDKRRASDKRQAARRTEAGASAAAARRSGGPRVSARLAARRIRGLAERCDDLELRGHMRHLARQVERASTRRRWAAACEAALGTCLDRADACAAAPEGSDAWLLRTAATWGVARLVRVQHGAGATGAIVEHLAGRARDATERLAARETAAAEFVLVLSRLFADLEACRILEHDVTAALIEELDRLVTKSGTVTLSGSAAMLGRIARWTALRDAALATGGAAWPEATEERWAAALREGLRLLGGGGHILVGSGHEPLGRAAILHDALRSKGRHGLGQKTVRRTAKALLAARPRTPRADAARLLPRAAHDAEAAVAVLRSGWHRDGLRVMLDYRDGAPRLEIAVDDRLLVNGTWTWSVTIDGRPREAEGPWTVSCWESDRKATVLEIAAPLGGGLQIERQIVLMPRDMVVVLADAITFGRAASDPAQAASGSVSDAHVTSGNGRMPPGEIDYRGVVPLATGLDAETAAETREIFFYDGTMRGMALPLGLNEWQGVGRGGWEATPAGLVLSQVGRHRLYAPVWIDCRAGRLGGPLTWRHLTVADTRLILPPHQAVGYRVQAGDEQWLLYKTLDTPRNRTLLGCNVSCDFLVGRLKRSGEVARILEIQ